MKLAEIDEVIAAVAAGRPVIVADDENRENEGDVILSAALATQSTIAWTVKNSSGLLCAPMSNEVADRLALPMMVEHNEDVRCTAYTVTVDAAEGVTTGISASDRAHTLNTLADPASTPASLHRPGHILPLRAVDGGVRQRPGHTEASVELMKLAGLPPVAVIAEIVADNGEMMRLPGLVELGATEKIPVTTIEKLIAYLQAQPTRSTPRVSLRADTQLPTKFGTFRVRAFRDMSSSVDHLAISHEPLGSAPLVRVHSECLTGEVLGSTKCECAAQLEASLKAIAQHGGVVIYMRGHEGRGIGLTNKLRAYALQAEGLDTVEANLQLGLPVDDRHYDAAAEILRTLGIHQLRLLTNNPEKVSELEAHGIHVDQRESLIVDVNKTNADYLATKREKLGHFYPTNEHLLEVAQ